VLGYDRHRIPVAARIFRPVPTQVVLVGGLRTAQLIAFRASALGALIDVRTRRWAAWSWFADELAAPAGTFTVTPDAAAVPPWAAPWPDAPGPGETAGPPHRRHAGSVDTANARRPTLTIVDAATRALSAAQRLPHTGAPGTAAHADAARWHTVLTVRDELASADTGLLTAADLVVLQTLRPDEADLVADTFGLEDAAGYLTGLSDELVGLVGNDQPLSWAALALTPIERSLIGPADWDRTAPSDVDALQPVTRAGKSPRGGD
jgi:hypothetical protein